MSENLVTVSANFGADTPTGQLVPAGTFLFAATGSLMDSTNLAIVTPVLDGALDANGSFSVQLLASDNFSAGSLNWNCFVRVQGMPLIHVMDFPVNFSNGASQNLLTILSAAGWTPIAI